MIICCFPRHIRSQLDQKWRAGTHILVPLWDSAVAGSSWPMHQPWPVYSISIWRLTFPDFTYKRVKQYLAFCAWIFATLISSRYPEILDHTCSFLSFLFDTCTFPFSVAVLRKLHVIFHIGHTNLLAYCQYFSISNSYHFWLFVVLLIVIVTEVEWYLLVVFLWSSLLSNDVETLEVVSSLDGFFKKCHLDYLPNYFERLYIVYCRT